MHRSNRRSLNDLVCGREIKRPGGFGVDDELKFSRLHDRQPGRFGTLENQKLL
jgi:hypothetical protein